MRRFSDIYNIKVYNDDGSIPSWSKNPRVLTTLLYLLSNKKHVFLIDRRIRQNTYRLRFTFNELSYIFIDEFFSTIRSTI